MDRSDWLDSDYRGKIVNKFTVEKLKSERELRRAIHLDGKGQRRRVWNTLISIYFMEPVF